MASFFPLFGIYLFLFTSLCVASPLTLEQRVQQMEKNNVSISIYLFYGNMTYFNNVDIADPYHKKNFLPHMFSIGKGGHEEFI